MAQSQLLLDRPISQDIFLPVGPATIGEHTSLTVDARTLHRALESGKDFSNWIKTRIEKYGFIKNQDYEVFARLGVNPDGGRPSQEYTLTLDMAKELCMVENTEKGRLTRRYFLECEKRVRQPQTQPAILDSPETIMARALMIAQDTLERAQAEKHALAQRIEQDLPKVLFANSLEISKSSVPVGHVAKLIKQATGHDIGRTRFFKWLRANGYLIKDGRQKNAPIQRAMDMGLFEIRLGTVNSPTATPSKP